MGCDGGTIPKRDELVRRKKKPEKKDKNSELSFRWRHCTITQDPLRSPIVACGLGRLYNKDSVIENLLNKTPMPENASHVKSLKDIKDLSLSPNPEFISNPEKGDGYIDRQTAPYICPVMGIEMNGYFKFILIWNCGCVLSDRCLKSVKGLQCLKCQKPFQESDIVILNPTDEETPTMRTQMESRQKKLKEKKKAKKSPKVVETGSESLKEKQDIVPVPQDIVSVSQDIVSVSQDIVSVSQDSKNTSTNKIKENKLKRPSPEIPKDLKMQDPAMKKMKMDYSVAKDPKSSEVYKSLFTTHSNAQHQTRAHWVTYNPFYN